MEKAILQVRDLSFSYEEKMILKNMNLTIRKGEKIAFMGSNGAGKSTFFLNLNGVLQPQKGDIILEGQAIVKKQIDKLHRRVGFVFQDADSQIIAANVRAEISFGPVNLGWEKEEVRQRVDEAIDYMDLKMLEERPPHYLSGGEKKKVCIADILAMQTDIMIFDEPMAALDSVNAENVEQILQRLHEDGKTLLVATHDVDFAYRFADRIVVFSEGEIIADGLPKEVFHDTDVMKKAHLKPPVLMTIWEAMVQKHLVEEGENDPVTAQQLMDRLQ